MSLKRAVWRRVAPPLGTALRASKRPVGIALLHHALDERRGDLETELVPALDKAAFEAQLEHLSERYDVIHASELPKALSRRRRWGRIPAAITFDDDLPSHRDIAAPALQRHGLTATFFLTGAALEGPFRFWWERLQDAVDRDLDVAGALSPLAKLPDRAAAGPGYAYEVSAAIRSLEPRRRQEAAELLGELAGPDPPDSGLRADDVRRLADAGFEIGFHTRRHPYLPDLDDAALRDAMGEGREELEAVAGRPVRTIAYPHGGVDARIAAAARESGFQAGFTTAADATTASTDSFLIGRVDPLYYGDGDFGADLAWRLVRA